MQTSLAKTGTSIGCRFGRGALRLLLAFVILAPAAAHAELVEPLWPFGPRGLMLARPQLLGDSQLEDVYVMPARPGQNRVSYWDWDWQTWEFRSDPGGGGVRLFFYPRERQVAEYAVYSIREQYERLTELFHYMPRTQIPFVLYASYAEFQATNVFFVTEGTLGATDPRDLRMAQPFFGDVRKFTRVSTHEMAHQFTIQKVRDAALAAGVENPLMGLPLWFIEGLAEYMVYLGMDPEGDLMVRDLLLNPVPEQGYAMPDFFNATAGGYIGIYKLGQARVTFLAQVYGHRKVLELMERAPEMAGAAPPGSSRPPTPPPAVPGSPQDTGTGTTDESPEDQGLPPSAVADESQIPVGPPQSFEEFVARVVGESPTKIRERYQAWLKRRYFDNFLEARQHVADFSLYLGLKGEPDSISIGGDGNLLLYRSVERMTGLSSLFLQDLRDPESRVKVATDQRPGLESLHPVDRRVTALAKDRMVFAARSGENDVLYLVPFEHRTTTQSGVVSAELELGSEERFELGEELLEIFDPALSPDGKRVAFAAIDPSGFRDLYVLDLEGPNRGKLERLTNDVWAEQDLFWDDDRLLFVSDATETHEPNVFALALSTRKVERLTRHAEENRHPVAAMGGILFRSNKGGKPDLWLLENGRERRLTDVPTGALVAAPAEDGLWALLYYKGEHRLYRMPSRTLLPEPKPVTETGEKVAGADAVPEPAVGGSGMELGGAMDRVGLLQVVPYPRAALPKEAVSDYDPSNPKNWRLEGGGAALVGPAQAGAAGVAITDLLRNHTVLINLAVYGTLKLTDASLFYLNQSQRPNLGIGAFHTFEPRRDKTFEQVQNFYLQRSFGVAGMVRYPLDRFRRLEGVLELRGIERFGFTDYTGELFPEWQRQNGGIEPEIVLSAAAGRDTTRMHALAGPVEGNSILLQASTGLLPVRRAAYARLMLDAQQRIRLIGRTHLALRASGGATWGGQFSPQYFLSSLDNLRGFNFGDPRLLGDHYYVSNAHLIVPVDWIIQTPLLSGIYAVGGADFGAAFDQISAAWDRRSLTAVLGTNLALGGILLQLHFGRLIDIGGVPGADWVFNLNLKYLYM